MAASLSGFYHAESVLAYRVLNGRAWTVAPSDAADCPALGGLIVPPGCYTIQGQTYDMAQPGVYRFQGAGRQAVQAVVLPSSPQELASVAAELGTLGNGDRNKPWSLLCRIAQRQRLAMHCMQISNFAIRLAAEAGLYGRTWLMWNFSATEAGDILGSHAITEIQDRARKAVHLFDLSFGVELVVKPGETDFARFQSALLADEAVQIELVSHGFGYEYGSRFFNPHSDDFDLDALVASPAVLLESYRRLVSGSYVYGGDLENRTFVTTRSQAFARDADLSSEQRQKLQSAEIVGPSDERISAAPPPSRFRSADSGMIGYRLAQDQVTPIPAASGNTDISDLDLAAAVEAGITLFSGAQWRIGAAELDLRQDGLYRLRPAREGPAHQALAVSQDPMAYSCALLEGIAAGSLHDDMATNDLRLAAGRCKAVAMGGTVLRYVTEALALARIPLRIWQLPSALSGAGDWPVPTGLTLLELTDLEGQIRLIDPHRSIELMTEGSTLGFAAFEAAVLGGDSLDTRSLCLTPRLSYGAPDRKTGLSPDMMMPLWLGDRDFARTLWTESLNAYPALAQDTGGRPVTTSASQDRAHRCLEQDIPGRRHWERVLAASPIG